MSGHDDALVIIEEHGACQVARLLAESLFDPILVSRVDEQLRHAVESAATPRIVLTFDTVEHLSSSMLSVLIALHRSCADKGGEACLAAVPPKIAELLKVARLDDLFRTFPTTEKAVEALA